MVKHVSNMNYLSTYFLRLMNCKICDLNKLYEMLSFSVEHCNFQIRASNAHLE